MPDFLQKVIQRLKVRYPKILDWLRASWQNLKLAYEKLATYFQTHPRERKAAIILCPPFGIFLLILLVVWIETPWNSDLRNIQNQVATEIYSADSVLLGRYYIQDRTEVSYEEIAPAVVDALVATEDARFYKHSGVDYRSLARVIVKSILQQDESAGGGSTLTQQLSKNLYPRKNYWFLSMLINKMREVRTAIKLENIYSKEELITLYLNTVPFADNVFGIEAAAERFYSVHADELTINQSAVLVGMLKATHTYNPRLFPDRALKRRNVVLGQMLKYSYITKDQVDTLVTRPIDLEYNKVSHHQGLAPYFREYLKSELLTWCENNKNEDGNSYNLYTDGLRIYTTLDSKLQEYAEKAVSEQMSIIQNTFFDHWGKDKPWKGKEQVLEQAIQRSPRYQKLKDQQLSEEAIMKILQKPIAMELFSWQGTQEAIVSPIDSIIHHLQYLNAGFLAMEPSSGQVKAWVGGIDHDFYQFDHVNTNTKRQVGSIFKPIVYAMALEEGVDPCALISASRETYIDKEGKEWTPRNSQNDYEMDYSMRGALAYSVNTVAAKLIDKAGVKNTIRLAHAMGVTSEIPDVPSIALGAASVSLMEMTTVFSCFANKGIPVSPYYISSIHDNNGKVYDGFKDTKEKKAVFSEETAQIMIALLRSVVNEGTAGRLRYKYGVYSDVAGKTGTTQSNADGWFMAMTPNLVIGTWVGADDPRIRFRSTALGQGSSTALPITGSFLKQVNDDPAFKSLSQAKFDQLPSTMQQKLDCDLYELSDDLVLKIERSIFQRDSLIQADTTATPPPETFLQTVYKRKLRIKAALEKQDSIARLIDLLGG
ncbi:MAG: penicillin-binding protein [Cyclobacteriaceae bacterium]|nr:penicillin-binding protein [Cyclobacteriaceae bacterium]